MPLTGTPSSEVFAKKQKDLHDYNDRILMDLWEIPAPSYMTDHLSIILGHTEEVIKLQKQLDADVSKQALIRFLLGDLRYREGEEKLEMLFAAKKDTLIVIFTFGDVSLVGCRSDEELPDMAGDNLSDRLDALRTKEAKLMVAANCISWACPLYVGFWSSKDAQEIDKTDGVTGKMRVSQEEEEGFFSFDPDLDKVSEGAEI